MDETTGIEMELNPRLQQMLSAYRDIPARDPEAARRAHERFMGDLNQIYVGQAVSQPTAGWFTLIASVSNLAHLGGGLTKSVGRRTITYALITLTVLGVFLFGGLGITAYAASSSLPGDAIYPLKTTIENVQVNLTFDSAARARLYLDYAARRLSEIQSLVDQHRYTDIAQAAGEFERDVQKALGIVESLSMTDPAGAAALNAEISTTLQRYANALTQLLLSIPADVQLVIQNAINVSQSAAGDSDNDRDDNEGDDVPARSPTNTPSILPTDTPSVLPSVTPTSMSVDAPSVLPSVTPTSAPVDVPGVLPSATSTSMPVDAPSVLPSSTPTSVPLSSPTSSVVEGGDAICHGLLGAITVNNVLVPQGANCTLDGTTVNGNIRVEYGASLSAQRVAVIGSIQAVGANQVEVLAGSTVGGNIQLKQGGAARVENVVINGDIQFEFNNGAFSTAYNQVGGSVQVFQNSGGVTVMNNMINGNLQCKENFPEPIGENNVVQGNKEDQCAGL